MRFRVSELTLHFFGASEEERCPSRTSAIHFDGRHRRLPWPVARRSNARIASSIWLCSVRRSDSIFMMSIGTVCHFWSVLTGSEIQVELKDLFVLGLVRYCVQVGSFFLAGILVQDVLRLPQVHVG